MTLVQGMGYHLVGETQREGPGNQTGQNVGWPYPCPLLFLSLHSSV